MEQYSFSDNLKFYRKTMGLTQKELEKMVGVGQVSIVNYDRGIRFPGEDHDIALVMISQLIRLEGWDSVFLGTDVPMKSLMAAIDWYMPDVIAISATMSDSINGLDAYLEVMQEKLSDRCRVILGGKAFIDAKNSKFTIVHGIACIIQESIDLTLEREVQK